MIVPKVYARVNVEFATLIDVAVAIAYKTTSPNRMRFTIISPRTMGKSVDTEFIKNLLYSTIG